MTQNLYLKKCAYCGKMFTTAHYPTQCCSQSCYFKHKLRSENQLKLRKLKVLFPHLKAYIKKDLIYYVKNCPVCGKVFDTTYPQQIYCSQSCKGRMKVMKERFDYSPSSLAENAMDCNPVRKVLRVDDACQYLSISKSTLYRFVENGYLSMYKLCDVVYFKVEELDNMFTTKNEMSTVDLLRCSKKYLSISEIAEKYGLKNSRVYKVLKDNKMHHIVSNKMYLYNSDEVETLFSHLLPDEEETTDNRLNWTTADELAVKYKRDRNFIYHFTASHHIPTSRVGRNVFYSSEHFAKSFKKYNNQHK